MGRKAKEPQQTNWFVDGEHSSNPYENDECQFNVVPMYDELI
jgi:hypothetical protein